MNNETMEQTISDGRKTIVKCWYIRKYIKMELHGNAYDGDPANSARLHRSEKEMMTHFTAIDVPSVE